MNNNEVYILFKKLYIQAVPPNVGYMQKKTMHVKKKNQDKGMGKEPANQFSGAPTPALPLGNPRPAVLCKSCGAVPALLHKAAKTKRKDKYRLFIGQNTTLAKKKKNVSIFSIFSLFTQLQPSNIFKNLFPLFRPLSPSQDVWNLMYMWNSPLNSPRTSSKTLDWIPVSSCIVDIFLPFGTQWFWALYLCMLDPADTYCAPFKPEETVYRC